MLSANQLLALAAQAQVPAFPDAASLNPGGLYGTSVGRATAVDAAGNQLVVGCFTATLTGAAPGAAMQVLDALGRVAATATAVAVGTAALGALAPGLYVVRASSGAVRLVME